MQKITPFLWFNNQAEDAVEFYTSIFKDSKKGEILRYTDAGPGPEGSVLTASFTISGQEFTAINGGPQFPFTEAVSFVVHCENQEEVDYYWERLLEEGQESMCGWLKDKFGLSWQVVPTVLLKLLADKNTKKVSAAMRAMFQMKKLEIAVLQKAFDEG